MKGNIKWSKIAILSVKWQKFPSEIIARTYGEQIFMFASLRLMHDLEKLKDDAIHPSKI